MLIIDSQSKLMKKEEEAKARSEVESLKRRALYLLLNELSVTDIFQALEELEKLPKQEIGNRIRVILKDSYMGSNGGLVCLCHHLVTRATRISLKLSGVISSICCDYIVCSAENIERKSQIAFHSLVLGYQALSELCRREVGSNLKPPIYSDRDRLVSASLELLRRIQAEIADRDITKDCDETDKFCKLRAATMHFIHLMFNIHEKIPGELHNLVKLFYDNENSQEFLFYICKHISAKYPQYRKGMKVEAQYMDNELWISATILNVNDDGTIELIYGDGKNWNRAPRRKIRKLNEIAAKWDVVDVQTYLDIVSHLVQDEGFGSWFQSLNRKIKWKIFARLEMFISQLQGAAELVKIGWYKATQIEIENKKSKKEREIIRFHEKRTAKDKKPYKEGETQKPLPDKLIAETFDSGAEALLHLWESKGVAVNQKSRTSESKAYKSDLTSKQEEKHSLLIETKAKVPMYFWQQLDLMLPKLKGFDSSDAPLLYQDPETWGGTAPAEALAAAASIEGVSVLCELLKADIKMLSGRNSILKYSTDAAACSAIYSLSAFEHSRRQSL